MRASHAMSSHQQNIRVSDVCCNQSGLFRSGQCMFSPLSLSPCKEYSPWRTAEPHMRESHLPSITPSIRLLHDCMLHGCVTDCHKFSCLKQHPLSNSHSIREQPRPPAAGFSALLSHGCILIWRLVYEKVCFQLLRAVSRIQFLAALGPTFPLP